MNPHPNDAALTVDAVREKVLALETHMNSAIVGQPKLNSRIILGLLSDGHLLVEGAPGLAKTTAIKTLSSALEADFRRIQFTPDLLPADLTGTEVFRPNTGTFEFQPGPVFHNLILADEVNRAPAKVQSALLEAMGERQVTVGLRSYPLPPLFLVMATQNPIEQEGTYPLPEAQLDRFLLYVRVHYPDKSAERDILRIARAQARDPDAIGTRPPFEPLPTSVILDARNHVLDIHMSEEVEQYIVELVAATRSAENYDPDIARWIRYGASPRASIALDRCGRAHAWLAGRDYAAPEDIQAIAAEVLSHRIVLNYEAQAEGISADGIIATLLERVPTL